jgi:hypothetical protein
MIHTDNHPESFVLKRDWFGSPDAPLYVHRPDLAAIRAIPSAKARARRIRQIVAERNPLEPHNTIKFGRLVSTLTNLTDPKPQPRRKPNARTRPFRTSGHRVQ